MDRKMVLTVVHCISQPGKSFFGPKSYVPYPTYRSHFSKKEPHRNWLIFGVFTEALKNDMVTHFEKSRLLGLYPGYLGSADLMKVWEQEYEVNEKSLKKLGLIK